MSALITFINAIMESVIPPNSADPRIQRMYRVRLTLVACVGFMWSLAFTALAMGTAPKIFPGFARSDDVKAQITEQAKGFQAAVEKQSADLTASVQVPGIPDIKSHRRIIHKTTFPP